MTYAVKVVDGKYKYEGEFHTIEPNTAIRDENGKLCGINNPRRMVYQHTYGGEAPFFQGIGDGRLLGTRCVNPDCEDGYQSIFIPFRIHCPDCLGKNEIVDLTNVANESATVHSFMITERTGAFNTLPKPIRFVNVEFPGVCTILMSYLACGMDPEIGMRVVPVFKTRAPTYTITDLAFVPAGTTAADLPEGFTFSR